MSEEELKVRVDSSIVPGAKSLKLKGNVGDCKATGPRVAAVT
jgi:hypothetical protein